jgi:hypothetical protein
MDHQGAGRSRPAADTRRQPPWSWPEGGGSGVAESTGGPAESTGGPAESTGPLPARSPGYGPAGSGARRILGPGTGPQRLIGSGGTGSGGFSPWHTGYGAGHDAGGPGADPYLPDDTTLLSPLPPLDDPPDAADQPDRTGPPGGRRGGRTKRRGGSRIAWLAVAVVVAAAAGLAGYKFLYEPRVNAPVPPTLRLPANASGSPGFDKALGRWQHIGTRSEDPMPLTITGLYPARFVLNGRSYVRTAASVTKTCSQAVYGTDLQAALQSGHCTQVVRASYISGDGTMMGTVGVVNLINSSAAQKAGQVTGPQEIIAPLSAKKGATSKLSNGTGVVQAVIKGHYLILTWTEFTSLKSPSGSAQRQALEQFAENLVTGSANINLSTRMLTGRP